MRNSKVSLREAILVLVVALAIMEPELSDLAYRHRFQYY